MLLRVTLRWRLHAIRRGPSYAFAFAPFADGDCGPAQNRGGVSRRKPPPLPATSVCRICKKKNALWGEWSQPKNSSAHLRLFGVADARHYACLLGRLPFANIRLGGGLNGRKNCRAIRSLRVGLCLTLSRWKTRFGTPRNSSKKQSAFLAQTACAGLSLLQRLCSGYLRPFPLARPAAVSCSFRVSPQHRAGSAAQLGSGRRKHFAQTQLLGRVRRPFTRACHCRDNQGGRGRWDVSPAYKDTRIN